MLDCIVWCIQLGVRAAWHEGSCMQGSMPAPRLFWVACAGGLPLPTTNLGRCESSVDSTDRLQPLPYASHTALQCGKKEEGGGGMTKKVCAAISLGRS